ncbi:MAG TPA: hypothetical protein VGL60_07995 [Acidimicrobiales bacterium]|jgi:hypothetical protein
MSAADVVVVAAAAVACVAGVVCLVAAGLLVSQVRRLERTLGALRAEVVPLLADARQAADAAATEMLRVGAVLEDAESVTSTVESATRLAHQAFANPIVKVLAWRAGAAGGLRQLRRGGEPPTSLDGRRRRSDGRR